MMVNQPESDRPEQHPSGTGPVGPGENPRADPGLLDPERSDEDRLDEAVEESFPASDPPSNTPIVGVGAPLTTGDQPAGAGRAMEEGDIYRCDRPDCGCEITVTRGPRRGGGGIQLPRCCGGSVMHLVA